MEQWGGAVEDMVKEVELKEGIKDFIPADVNISQRSINVYHLMERLENHEVNIKPDFQRHGVWTE